MTSVDEIICIYEALFDQCIALMESGKTEPAVRDEFTAEFAPQQVFPDGDPNTSADQAENALVRLVRKIRYELKGTAYGAIKLLCQTGASAEEISILVYKAEVMDS